MRIILDTHIFLWAISNPKRLEPDHRSAIESMANIVYVSSISIAEITIKASLDKLQFTANPAEIAKASGFELLDFTADDALLLRELPFHHKDPFDRMLIAQAIQNKYYMMTNDSKFKLYDCKRL